MLILHGHLKHFLKKVKNVVHQNIILVWEWTIYLIFQFLALLITIVFFLCGLQTLFWKKDLKLLSDGDSNTKPLPLHGQKEKKNQYLDYDFFKGMGYWTRANPEMCLLATKGKPKRKSKNVEQFILSARRKHSQKPDEARTRIVKLCGDVSRIELFARQKFDGWDCWGNEV
jgi:hypothetical protein